MEGEDHKKVHRKRQAGPKAEKKKSKKDHQQDLTPQQRNPRAFSIQHARKTAKIVQRSQDLKTKKHHIPLVDRTPVEPPPVVVAIVGPPKVGKTTLFQCIVKNYAKQRLANVQGPVTVVAGKNRRLTIVECNNDINAMIDVAKVADLVLLLVDASFGFEMETFEFLNICQVHGFPRIMGVLTHLDSFKDNKKMRKTKKRLKHRFWTEVYQGAKLFYLSGMVNGEYQKTEVHNLCRFISVMKFRPLQWRITHPYVIADRMEDISDPELLRQKPKSDRKVSLYGYVRGTHMKNHITVHIPGCGDYSISDMHFLPDPCPSPDREKRRSLSAKERMIYAPMSGVGGIVYDKDAVYIDLGGSHSHTQADENSAPANEFVASLMNVEDPLDKKMTTSHVTMFSGTAPITDGDMEGYDSGCPDDEDTKKSDDITADGRSRRPAQFTDNLPFSEDGQVNCQEKSKKKQKIEENLVYADSDDEDDENIQMFSKAVDKATKSNKIRSNENEIESESSDEDEESEEEDDDENDNEMMSEEDENSENDSEVDNDTVESYEVSDETDGDSDSEMESEVEETKLLQKPKKLAKSNAHDSKTGKELSSSDKKLTSDSKNVKTQALNASKLSNNVNKSSLSEGFESEDSDNSEDSSNDMEVDSKISKTSDSIQTFQSSGEDSGSENSEEESDDESNEEDDEDDVIGNNIEDGDNVGDEEEVGLLRWKSNLTSSAAVAYKKRQGERINYRKLIYGKDADKEEDESDDELGGLFKVLKQKSEQSDRVAINSTDCSKFSVQKGKEWDIEEVRELIKDCFVTGEWEKSEDAAKRLQQDDDLYGDFEDLETGEVHHEDSDNDDDEEGGGGDGEEDKEKAPEEERKKTKAEMTSIERRDAKKKRLKDAFNAQYDMKDDSEFYDSWKAETEQQAKLNRAEFEAMEDDVRVNYEGYRPGMYVRVEIEDVPCEFVTNFDATYPVILGGLSNLEENVGLVQCRIKKHRWHKRILKTKNPLIISLGWRRFQTMPMYSIQDHNMRNRLLKYTPEHLHCNATFYGPITPQNTGLLAVESVAELTSGFRVAATGVVLELDKSKQIVKKLKLTGTPNKIYKKTAFIQGMFNSALEVTKFEGAKLQTVSGIRGMIKKAAKNPEGSFRATFEDKILLSDIIFLRTWYPVQIPEFYNPVTSLLLPKAEKMKWIGMKTIGQLRREKGMTAPLNPDSKYKPVERKIRHMTPLTIPKELQKMLPFRDTPKIIQETKDPLKRVAVIREPHEAKVAKVMKMLKTLHEHKRKTERFKMRDRAAEHEKKMAKIDVRRVQKHKETKKNIYRALGQLEKKKQKFINTKD
ncbi:ribosome biogenesis protein BMS1 homolog [Mytilus trossulus]